MILPFSTRRSRTSWTSKVLYLASRTPRATFSKSMKRASRRSSVPFWANPITSFRSPAPGPPPPCGGRGGRATGARARRKIAARRRVEPLVLGPRRLARLGLGDGAALGEGHGEAQDHQARQEYEHPGAAGDLLDGQWGDQDRHKVHNLDHGVDGRPRRVLE